jgi:hypothetical protein
MKIELKDIGGLDFVFHASDFVLGVIVKAASSSHEEARSSPSPSPQWCIVRDGGGTFPFSVVPPGSLEGGGGLAKGMVVKLDGLAVRRREQSASGKEGGFTAYRIELTCQRVMRLSAAANQAVVRGSEALAAQAKIAGIGSLEQFSQCAPRQIINLLGVVKRLFDERTVRTKQGRDIAKRSFVLADQTGTVISTLWGAEAAVASSFVEGRTVLLLENAVATAWRGRVQVSVSVDTILSKDPSFTAARELVPTLEAAGMLSGIHVTPDEIADVYDVAGIAGLLGQLGDASVCVFGRLTASVTYIGLFRPCFFRCCPTCRQRSEISPLFFQCLVFAQAHTCSVVDETWCQRCNKTSIADKVLAIRISLMGELIVVIARFSFLTRCQTPDNTGQLSVTLFGRVAEEFLGGSATVIAGLSQHGKEALVSALIWKRHCLCFRVCDSKLRAIQCKAI